jgi:hypothetical protein
MHEVGSHRAARTIVLALVAGLVAFEIVLAVTAGAIGIPGVLIVPLHEITGGGTDSGGESVIAKQTPKSIPSETSHPAQASAQQAGRVEQIASTPTLPPPVVVDDPAVTPDVFALAVPIDATVNLPVAAVAHARAVTPSQTPPVASTPQASAATGLQEDGKPASPPTGVPGDLNLGSIPSEAADDAAAAEKKPRQTLRNSMPTEDLPWADTVPVPLSQLSPQAGAKDAAPAAAAPSPQQ